MKKQDLLNYIDHELLDKLFGFCYARTRDSFEAEELCSEIVMALVKVGNSDGEISSDSGAPYAFIWRVARNIYADFSEKRAKNTVYSYTGDPEDIFRLLPDETEEDSVDTALLQSVYRRIAYLTRAYREVMIAYYLDGRSVAEIAREQGTSENAIRQRLHSARNTVRNEVLNMDNEKNKPLALDQIDYVIWGTGNPAWGDPRDGFIRQFSKHIVWLCKKKPRTAREISEELNVPTAYVEEELEILRKGTNGKYGLLRKNESGRYALNFVLLDREEIEKAQRIYTSRMPKICDTIASYIEAHKEEYLGAPYLNRRVDMNLILWAQVHTIAHVFGDAVSDCLKSKYFREVIRSDREFSVFGYEDNGVYFGSGCDGISAQNVCGYSQVFLSNIYLSRIRKHFSCGKNIGNDMKIQLAIRAIDGLAVASLSDDEKEQAAKAISEGYLYRDGDTLYTKILVIDGKRFDGFTDSDDLCREFSDEVEIVAKEMAEFIRNTIPYELLSDYRHANSLANLPIVDALVESLIERGMLTPPDNGIGAEGCWMFVSK